MPNVLRNVCLIVLVLTRVGIADEPRPQADEKAVKAEMAKLEGTWFPTASTTEGQKADKLDKARLTVDGDRWIIDYGGLIVTPKFTVRPNLDPKELDVISLTQKDKILLRAIYELKGDTLRLGFAVGRAKRPTKFISEPGSKSGITIYRRKRDQAEKIAQENPKTNHQPAVAEKRTPRLMLSIPEPEILGCLTASPDGKILAAGDLHGNVLLFNAGTGQRLATLKGHDETVTGLAFCPDGTSLASGDAKGTLCLWNLATRAKTKTIPKADGEGLEAVVFSPDGKTLATGGWDGVIRLWNVATGEKQHELTGHEWTIDTLRFSPDGKRLASSSWDVTVRLWDVEQGKCLHTMEGHKNTEHSVVGINLVQGVVFSPDGKTLYSAATHIKVWDVKTGKEKRTIKDETRFHVYSLDISPDGKLLATGKYAGHVHLWDAATGERLATMKEHDHQIDNLLFSPDGKSLIAGSSFEGIKTWRLPTP